MAEYIEREALKEKVEEFERGHASKGFVITGEAIAKVGRMIDEIPAADVVEVCRGIDCRCWQANNGGYPHKECRWGKDETPDADDFCSYGEKRRADNDY